MPVTDASAKAAPALTSSLLAALASGLLLGLGCWSDGLGALLWVALAPVVGVGLRTTITRASLAACIAGTIGGLGLLVVYRGTPLPALGLALGALVSGILLAFVVAAARLAGDRLGAAAFVLAFATGATIVDCAAARLSPHGTAGSQAYSQASFLPLLQLAAWTGLWGIDFLVAAMPAAVAVAIASHDRRRASWLLAATLTTVAAVCVAGAVRVQRAPAHPALRVGVAASDGDRDAFATQDATRALAVAGAYAHRVDRLAAGGARVVVLPEELVGTTPADAAAVRSVFAAAARRNRTIVVAGVRERVAGGELRNRALVFAADGTLALAYDKIHLIPGVEPMAPGHAPGLLAGDGHLRMGVAICKDLDFVDIGRAQAAAGTRLLLVPAWDFDRDGWLHARMAIVRAVEAGTALARSARNGLVTVSDAWGRVHARAATDGAEASAVTDVPLGPGTTLYARSGDWFAAVCAIIWLILVGWALLARRRRS
jgi:apolipoprotein N-acyltransferase